MPGSLRGSLRKPSTSIDSRRHLENFAAARPTAEAGLAAAPDEAFPLRPHAVSVDRAAFRLLLVSTPRSPAFVEFLDASNGHARTAIALPVLRERARLLRQNHRGLDDAAGFGGPARGVMRAA